MGKIPFLLAAAAAGLAALAPAGSAAAASPQVGGFGRGGASLPATPYGEAGHHPLKIFLIFGQSNTQGYGFAYDNDDTAAWNIPTMEFLLADSLAADRYRDLMPYRFKDSLDASWLEPRSDAWCLHYRSSDGALQPMRPFPGTPLRFGVQPLSPGFGALTAPGVMFGPELGMGIRLADASDAPLLLFKSAKGGTTLGYDWRPPLAVSARGGTVGPNFTNSMLRLVELLDDLDADLADDGYLNAYGHALDYEISGMLWFQGWNEQFDTGPYTAAELQAEYADNLVDLVHSVRATDPRIPADLPAIIGESSDQLPALNAARLAAVATLNAEIPGSAAYFDTDDMLNVDWGNGPAGVPFSQVELKHYHLRAENYLEIGWKAAGVALASGYALSGGGGQATAPVDPAASMAPVAWTPRLDQGFVPTSGTSATSVVSLRVFRDRGVPPRDVRLAAGTDGDARPLALDFAEGRLQVGLPGQAEPWDTGLFLPEETWADVLVVLTPTRITLHVHDGGPRQTASRTLAAPGVPDPAELRIRGLAGRLGAARASTPPTSAFR